MNDDWMADAACRGFPSEWWHPDHDHEFFYSLARSVCDECPVQAECLVYVSQFETVHARFGMWAKTVPKEREGTAVRHIGREKACEWCGDVFTYRSSKARFCSPSCLNRSYETRRAS